MKLKALIAPLVLASGALASFGAMAQPVTVNGFQLSAQDQGIVTRYCRTMATLDRGAGPATGESRTSITTDRFEPSEIDQLVTKVDLEAITLDDCVDAGLAVRG